MITLRVAGAAVRAAAELIVMNKVLAGFVLVMSILCHAQAVAAPGDTAQALAPWLDIPATWLRSVENGVLSVMPDDLPSGSSLLLLIEPPTTVSTSSMAADYEKAVRDLAPWTPVGDPVEQTIDNGWVFRFGVGVVELNGVKYTAETAVARHGEQLARFWVLADSDDTFNRYKAAFGTAISSVQDLTLGVAAAGKPPGQTAARVARAPLDNTFGRGVSGVYVGLERGLSAGAGFGQGQQQTYNQSTGQFESSMTGTAPGVQTSIADYTEVDVLFPDGTYRRRMPDRGLASDLAWDRANRRPWWGTWSRQGELIVTNRGGYTTTYRINGKELISERDRPWVKLLLSKNSRIDGAFARADYRDGGAPRLVFHADGRYEDRGDFLRMVGSAANLIVPDGDSMVSRWTDAEARQALAGGSGSYTFEAFTLTLNDRDGRVWQIGIYVPPGENISQPRQLAINGRLLLRD